MFWVYVLYSDKDNKLYTGYTNNPKSRSKEHQTGKVLSTKFRGELKLIYLEACINKFDALVRKKYLKSGRGKLFLKKRLKYWYKERVQK